VFLEKHSHGDPSFDREEPRIAMQFSFLWTHLGLCAHVLGVHKIGTETERKMSLKTKNPDYVSNVRTYIRTAIIVSGSRTCGPNDGSSDSLMMATLSDRLGDGTSVGTVIAQEPLAIMLTENFLMYIAKVSTS